MIRDYHHRITKAAPLAVFRILFGLVMAVSLVRFWMKGWIEKLYLAPKFHFHYSGFDFVEVPGKLIYLVFLICLVSAIMIAIGLQYKLAIVTFFLTFTFMELLDKSTYLNHYYFVSVISFILIFLPAHCSFSYDAMRRRELKAEYVQRWTVDVLKLMLALVYVYAGLAKLNHDWMIEAMPLKLWLLSHTDLPIIGSLMDKNWLHYLFSWGGALYDLTIVFFLLWSRTRLLAYAAVIVFHILTRVLFPIGMFPYIMILSTLIFFSSDFHESLLKKLQSVLKAPSLLVRNGLSYGGKRIQPAFVFLSAFMVFQMLFPLRSYALTDDVYWTERGYRFSWRVMLMEKTGHANFKIVDGKSGKRFYVQNEDFLTAFQQKQMSTQPDFILEYGQYLGEHFASQGHKNIEVYVESTVAINGRKSQNYIDPEVDLMQVNYSQLVTEHLMRRNE